METETNIKDAVSGWMDKIYLDFQGPPGLDGSVEAGKTVLEHYLVKLLTNVVVNACAAWWSIKVLWDYL